jgi:hypothetical protein
LGVSPASIIPAIFLERFAHDRLFGGFARIDHSGDQLGDPSVGARRIVAAPGDQGWQPELLDQHHGLRTAVEQ